MQLAGLAEGVQGQDILHFIEAPEYAEVLEDARGLKLTDDGTVYVTSEQRGQLLKIVDGKIEQHSLVPSAFDDEDLGGIDVLPDGRLVIVNEGSGKVGVLNSGLEPEILFSSSGGSVGELDDPLAVAVSVNGNIFVGDVKNRQVSVFNHQGLFLDSFGRQDSEHDDLLAPTHVGIDAEERVYVLEGQSRISIFDWQGQLIERITARDLQPLFDNVPEFSAMAVDADGRLYLGDHVTSRITVFDWRKREILQQFGALGQSRSQYRRISQLSVNRLGQIAILDTLNRKIEVFQLEYASNARPVTRDRFEFAMATEASCRAASAFGVGKLLCLREDGRGITVLASDGSELGGFAEEVKKPSALHASSQAVAILENNQLHAYRHDGSKIFSLGRYGTSAGGFKDPVAVYIHGGNYYVSDQGNNRVQVFSSDGQFIKEIRGQRDDERLFAEVGALAVDSQENLYVADTSRAARVQVIDKEGQLIASIGIGEDSRNHFSRLLAIDIDLQDRLYLLVETDYNDFGVRVYRDFEPYRIFGSAGNNGTLASFDEASSISVLSGQTNSVYVNDRDHRRIFRFDLLEYPDPAFGLNIAANRSAIELLWSSSQSPLISAYEIESAQQVGGPYRRIATTSETRHELSLDEAGDDTWFRVVSVSGHGLRAAPSTPKQNQFQIINSLHQQGDYGEAIRLADRLLKIVPDNADARDLLAMSLYRIGDHTRAIAEFRRLAETDAYRDKALRYQVQSYYQLDQLLDARALIDDVLALEPVDAEPYLLCTQLSLDLDDAIGAATCAEDGLDRQPDNIEMRYLLGRAYIAAGLEDDGLLAFETIVDTAPDDYAIRLRIADDLQRLGRHQQALAEYSAVADAQPDSGQARVGKASALLALGRADEAKSIALKLSGKRETRGDGYYLLGKIAAGDGSHKEAVLRLTRAVKDSPQVVDAWLSLAQAYEAINQPDKAVQSLAKGIDSNPQAFELYQQAGKLELGREQYPQANAYLDTAVNLNPGSLQAQSLYARSLFATRNYRSAAIHADAAAKIAPQNIDVLVLQADIANQQGKIGSAIEYLKTAISIDSASPELQYRIGRVYQDANLFDASQQHLERAAAIQPDWAAPHVALGNLFSKRRRFDDAVAAYEKAVELEPTDDNRAILNVAFAERKKSLEFDNNAPQLRLSDLNLQRVFSAAYKKYQDKPIGSVKLENVGGTEFGNLKLSFQIKEFMDFPSAVEIPRIAANETLEIPIKATFNNRILEVDEDTGVQVEVRLSYLRDGQNDDISLTQPMTIYGKNAIVWKDPHMIGSFVTPKDDTLRNYVRQVVNSFQPDPGPLNDKLVAAMSYFSSLTASGTSYIVDPNTPFTELRDDQIDYVQFPRETLRLKSGDCDDLSVLISAGLENLGIRTAFVEVPGHLFLMFDTGLEAGLADLISQDRNLLVVRDDTVWIPLEATMINTDFNEAWAEGARKYQAALAAEQLGIIDLRQAWQSYKPVTLRQANYNIDLPQPQRAASLVNQARKVLLAKSIDRLILPYQTMVANNPKDLAARLQIAILYTRYGLYADAELAFEALSELAPQSSAVKTNQGNLYFLQGNYDRAIENYRRAADLDTEDGGILINLSMAHYKAGDLTKARTSYQNALELNASLQQEYDAYSKLLSQ